MSILLILVTCVATILIGVYSYIKWKYTYWKAQGFPDIEPTFPFGTLGNPMSRKIPLPEILQNNYNYFRSQGHKHGGLYSLSGPFYLPVHPETVKAVMSKDFNHFNDRGLYYNEKDDPLSAHMFNIGGLKWRKMRVKLTPTFTSGKMKMMFQILLACSNNLVEAVGKSSDEKESIDAKEVVGCFSTDVIGSCAFGIECNSFENPESEFRKYGRQVFLPFSTLQVLRNILVFSSPAIGRLFKISLLPKDTTNFFLGAVKETVEFREKHNFKRNDFMQILINLKNEESESPDSKSNLTIEEIAAHAFVFFIAGFETSSTTMSFCLFELALNQEIQEKARYEVTEVIANNDGNFTYDSMMKMKYLLQVIEETLRKYPAVPVIPRMCVKDYQIPNSKASIKKGTRVFVPAFALHRDPEFFPEPEKFDPERFNEVNKPKIPAFSYIPFGEGPRNCIGSRFGLMQVTVALAVLLKNFKFTLNQKTSVPLQLNPFSFVLLAKDGVWLDVEKITA